MSLQAFESEFLWDTDIQGDAGGKNAVSTAQLWKHKQVPHFFWKVMQKESQAEK